MSTEIIGVINPYSYSSPIEPHAQISKVTKHYKLQHSWGTTAQIIHFPSIPVFTNQTLLSSF